MSHFNNSKLVIMLLGAPGSGKGVQATLLADKFSLHYLDTSKLLEEKFRGAGPGSCIDIKGEKFFLEKEKELWEKGILCSPAVATYLIKEKIEELFKMEKNLILPGSPRTIYEAKEVLPLLKKLYGSKNIKVVLLNISAQKAIWRNSHRKICELSRHSILRNKETAKLKFCPLDGSKLVKRGKLDKPETIKIRLNEFRQRTLPVINYLRKNGVRVREIDGSPPPSDVFKNILKAL